MHQPNFSCLVYSESACYESSVHCLNFYITVGAETNQELIMAQGGIGLLARTADDAEDPQTLRMVAGAIANLCGNGTSILNHSLCITKNPVLVQVLMKHVPFVDAICRSTLCRFSNKTFGLFLNRQAAN